MMVTIVRPLRALAAAVLVVAVAGGCSQGDDAVAGTGSEANQAASTDDASASGPPQEQDGVSRTRAQPTAVGTSVDEGGDDTSAEDRDAESPVPEADNPSSGSEEDGDTGAAPEESGTAPSSSSEPVQTQDFDYPDDPEPAQGVVATLCNLDSDYLLSLRNEDASGQAIVDDDLRLSVLALGDQLSYWESLRFNFPEVSADVDRAQRVYDLWDTALVDSDNGDSDSARLAMLEADEEIESLRSGAASVSSTCVG